MAFSYAGASASKKPPKQPQRPGSPMPSGLATQTIRTSRNPPQMGGFPNQPQSNAQIGGGMGGNTYEQDKAAWSQGGQVNIGTSRPPPMPGQPGQPVMMNSNNPRGGYNPIAEYDTASDIAKLVAGTGPMLSEFNPATATQAGFTGADFSKIPALTAANITQEFKPYEAARVSAASAKASSLLENLEEYMNPYTEDVVDTSLAEYDDAAGRQRTALQAEALANGDAFGGSRYAIRESQFENDLLRNRAAFDAGIRSDAFNTGAGLSASDADRRTQVSMQNSANRTQASAANAAAKNAAMAQAQQAELQRALTNAQLGQDAGKFNSSLLSQLEMFNSGQENDMNRFNAGLQTGIDQFNSQLGTQNDQYNAGQFNAGLDRSLGAAGLLGNLAGQYQGNERADIGLLADLGNQERAVNSDYATSDLSLLAQMQGLLSGNPYNLFNGSSSFQTGTDKTTKNPSLLDGMNSVANLIGAFKNIGNGGSTAGSGA